MKNIIKKLISIASLLTLLITSNILLAETTANVGLVSQYYYRGIQQTAGASASAGIDFSQGDFSLGAWSADVGDGLEIDLYGSYAFKLSDTMNFSLGATSYQYTGDFDSAYNEVNLGFEISDFSLAYNIGKWDGVVGNESATEQNYTVLNLAYTIGSFTGTVGVYGDETEGEYFDLLYETKVGEFDVGVGLLISGSELDDDESLYFSFSKEIAL